MDPSTIGSKTCQEPGKRAKSERKQESSYKPWFAGGVVSPGCPKTQREGGAKARSKKTPKRQEMRGYAKEKKEGKISQVGTKQQWSKKMRYGGKRGVGVL